MTAIVALKHKGIIYLAGDRCGSNGYSKSLGSNPKIFKTGEFYLGYTSSFYMGQILEHIWTPPPRTERLSDNVYFYKHVVPSLRNCLVDNHYGKYFDEEHKEPNLGSFIIVYKNKIFVHHSNGAVIEVEYAGVGCGGESVLSSVLCMLDLAKIVPGFTPDMNNVFNRAFARCAEFYCGVSPEFDLMEIAIE